jgi:hypothetical protein
MAGCWTQNSASDETGMVLVSLTVGGDGVVDTIRSAGLFKGLSAREAGPAGPGCECGAVTCPAGTGGAFYAQCQPRRLQNHSLHDRGGLDSQVDWEDVRLRDAKGYRHDRKLGWL